MITPSGTASYLLVLIACLLIVPITRASAQTPSYPDWLFPVDPTAGQPRPIFSDVDKVSIPDGEVEYTAARINNPFDAPDWHPTDHEPMPNIVAKGRRPDIIACAYCHTPTGQGRPENAALAGLPAEYIVEQLKNMRSGARRQIGPDDYLPILHMIRAALPMTDREIAQAAGYFSKQTLGTRVRVIEARRIPKPVRAGWVYAKDPAGGEEDLSQRIIEMAPDIVRHERRDDRMVYTAYVPPGSIARGQSIASGKGNASLRCSACHGPALKGTELGPPIAGRSPTYLARQLLAFKQETRSTPKAAAMENMVVELGMDEVIALAAYAGSLSP